MILRSLTVVAVLAMNARADAVKAPKCGPPKTTKKKLASVRDVDWCNFDVGAWKGPLREGHSSLHLYSDMGGPDAAPHDTIAVSLNGIIYGDLDGDKRPEAALVLQKTTWIGRTGDHSTGSGVSIYGLVKGVPTRLGSIPAGTPVDAVTIAKGIVTVTSGPKGQKTTLRYRRDKDDFVEVVEKK